MKKKKQRKIMRTGINETCLGEILMNQPEEKEWQREERRGMQQ